MESFSGDVKSIKMDLKACSVSVVAEDGCGLKSTGYTGDKKLMPEISFENGELTVTQNSVGGIFHGAMVINKPCLTVTVGKETVLNDLDIKINAGDVSVSGITADWFSGVINSGNLSVSDGNFLKAEFRIKAGNVNFRNTNFNKAETDVKAGSVKFDIEEDFEQYDIECKVKTGSVKAGQDISGREYSSKGKNTNSIPNSIKINVATGNIEIGQM